MLLQQLWDFYKHNFLSTTLFLLTNESCRRLIFLTENESYRKVNGRMFAMQKM